MMWIGHGSRSVTGATSALLLGAALGLSGCSGGSTIVTDDGKVSVNDNGIKIETSEGTATLTGKEGRLPDGWPDTVAIPEGGTVSNGVTYDTAETKGWTASISYPGDSADKISSTLASSLTAAGFDEQSTFTVSGSSVVSYVGNQMQVTTSVSASDGTTTLVITILEMPAAE